MFTGPIAKWKRLNAIATDSGTRAILTRLALRRYKYPGFALLGAVLPLPASGMATLNLKAGPTAKPVSISIRLHDVGDIAGLFENWIEMDAVPAAPVGPRLLVDAGANIGTFSLLFHSYYPDCEIVAIEPDAANQAILRENLSRNGANARIVGAALWDKDVAKLYLSAAASNAAAAAETPDDGMVEVAGVTLGTALGDGVGPIDYIKMDIEGAEYTVLPSILPSLPEGCRVWMELHNVGERAGWMETTLAGCGCTGMRVEDIPPHEMWLLRKQ